MGTGTVTRGKLEIITLTMNQFDDQRQRKIRVWLPDNYDPTNTSKKYPVMYMHDGQNLFDANTSYSGEWKIDETIGQLMDEGYPGVIVVGIDNGPERLNEYSPAKFIITATNEYNIVGEGEKYAAFVVETVKPYVDNNFNTLSDKEYTYIGGSSMGGIISFFTALTYQDIFGKAIIFSSSFWLYATNTIQTFLDETIETVFDVPKMYLYHGDAEGSNAYLQTLSTILSIKGVASTSYTTYIGRGRDHSESAWSVEFPRAFKWLEDLNQK